MKHIAISIEYAGLQLPVVRGEQNTEIVPFKPLVGVFGLDWMTQYKKIQSPWMTRHLGVCVGLMPYAGEEKREMVCIRLDRVATYLSTINPDRVRANGNTDAADFLEAKLTEWADALHDYETFGSAHNPRHADARLALARTSVLLKALRQSAGTKNPADRALLQAAVKRLAGEAGLPYHPDAFGRTNSATGDLFSPQA